MFTSKKKQDYFLWANIITENESDHSLLNQKIFLHSFHTTQQEEDVKYTEFKSKCMTFVEQYLTDLLKLTNHRIQINYFI